MCEPWNAPCYTVGFDPGVFAECDIVEAQRWCLTPSLPDPEELVKPAGNKDFCFYESNNLALH